MYWKRLQQRTSSHSTPGDDSHGTAQNCFCGWNHGTVARCCTYGIVARLFCLSSPISARCHCHDLPRGHLTSMWVGLLTSRATGKVKVLRCKPSKFLRNRTTVELGDCFPRDKSGSLNMLKWWNKFKMFAESPACVYLYTGYYTDLHCLFYSSILQLLVKFFKSLPCSSKP